MSFWASIIVAGAAVGFLESFSIWFVPEEPYPGFIVAAGTLKGVLSAVLIAGFVGRSNTVGRALGVGALVGVLMSGMVFLAKGGWSTWDAPFVVPSGVVEGLVLGFVVRRLNPRHVE